MFRRALCEHDQSAWARIVDQYRGMVLSWVRRHPAARVVEEEDDHWVDLAFTRLFQAIKPERFDQFPDAGRLLKYLQMCVNSVLQDAMREHAQRPPTVSIDVGDDDPEGALAPQLKSKSVVDHALNAKELWTAVERVLPDEGERRLAYLTLVLEYKPREIQALYPDRFPTVQGLYPLIRQVVERLQRHPDIRSFLT